MNQWSGVILNKAIRNSMMMKVRALIAKPRLPIPFMSSSSLRSTTSSGIYIVRVGCGDD